MIIGKRQEECIWEEGPVQCFSAKEECTPNRTINIKLETEIGKYTLCIDVKPQVKSNFAIVYQDQAEIGAFAVPYTGNIDEFGRYQPIKSEYRKEDVCKAGEILRKYGKNTRNLQNVYTFEVPLVMREKECQISICAAPSCLNDSMKTYNSEGFVVERICLQKGIRVPASFFERKRPGKSLVDLWGWMSMTSFEHPGDRVTPFREQVLRGIKEAYPWGANNFEFLPVNMDGVALDLSKEENWEGKQTYKQSADRIWSAQKVQEIIRTAKEYGMLTEFFLYCLHGAGFIATDMNYQQKVNLFEKIVKNYSNSLEAEQFEDLVDGIITEAWFPVDGPAYVGSAWKWNPGLFHLVSNNDGSQYDVHSMGYTPATHAYSAHWPGFDTQHTGYDHSYPLIPYPKDFYEQEEGVLYTYMQGCGQTCHPRKKYPRLPDIPLGITNRTVSPDWIVAQAHNYGLRNLWNEDDHLAMALCWEADEQTMCPEEARHYVYASSQDPVRLAACYRLEDIGAGGELELKRATRKFHPWDKTRLRARSKYPAASIVNGNRFLQMISLQNRDETILQCDLSESGTFYNNGAVAEVAFPFVITRFYDNRFLEKESVITESAGPVAILTEKSTMGSGFVTFRQEAVYKVLSELPAVFTQISRQMQPGQAEEIQTVIGLIAYDSCKVTGNLVCLCDSTGVLPEAVVMIGGAADSIEYVSEQGVTVTSSLSTVHSLEIVTFLKMGDFKRCSAREICEVIQNACRRVTVSEVTEITNETSVSMPIIVEIENASNAPCFVKENGVWQHRGAAFSQSSVGSAFVRLYLKAGETGAIRPYGYLEGIRAGRGCQNIVGFSDIRKEGNTIKAKVWIDCSNPMLHAPVIECESSIEAVKLNGKDYRYFKDRFIYLSQGNKEADMEVTFGVSHKPALIATYARVTSCGYDDRKQMLRIQWENQPWVKRTDIAHRAVVETGDRRVKEMKNAVLLNGTGSRILIELKTGDSCDSCVYFEE